MPEFFRTSIEFLKGVGPQKAVLLNQELDIFTFGDFIQHYPFRYEDRTKFYSIKEVKNLFFDEYSSKRQIPHVQIIGEIKHLETVGSKYKKRLVAYLGDGTGEIELVWFQGIQYVIKKLQSGVQYVVFGKPNFYNRTINIAHPELEIYSPAHDKASYLQPIYSTTEKLKNKFIDSKNIGKWMATLLQIARSHVNESLPDKLLAQFALLGKFEALFNIHFPQSPANLQKAQFRLKFEEFFYIQLRLLMMKVTRVEKFKGQVFKEAGLLTNFYNNHLPFDLTDAQKRVIKEIYANMKSGSQMNRLMQGDVGSGKTIVAFICMLLVIGSGAQAALMAPTEILAEQHYRNLKYFTEKLSLNIALLTGSTRKKNRRELHAALEAGTLNILVGTHALLEEVVKFQNLGLAVIDEQHRFGVAQRAKLWAKNEGHYPHVLVMTATPIPRTLAMTLYGDLDVSTIDELPKGRKPIETVHRFDSHRLKVFGFMREQIKAGRQVYIVYPLIEESEKMDLKNLEDGYESIRRAFPEYNLSLLHGRMKSEDKEYEMQRFLNKETQIMIATTVIEVGVDVPNASVMIIENAERFGLSQLHQLRGRVGRGAEQSYCLLMTGFKLSKEAKIRIDTMVRTNNGFDISETDLKIRGPGDLMGTQQSGIMDLLIADLAKDNKILEVARSAAIEILDDDPQLVKPEHAKVKAQINKQRKHSVNWSRIS